MRCARILLCPVGCVPASVGVAPASPLIRIVQFILSRAMYQDWSRLFFIQR